MGYEYESGSDSAGELSAPDVVEVDGACPPMTLRFRIYPSEDFNEIFATPPANVIT